MIAHTDEDHQKHGYALLSRDIEDNAVFFAEAYGFYGPLIDTVLQECDRDTRNPRTGQPRTAR